MRAYGFVRVGGPETETYLDVPEPVPGQGELLLHVRAAGVNPGDRRMREGFYGDVKSGILGREVAGTVVRVGSGVVGFAPGDEVFGGCPDMLGGWAERALVTAGFAARRPAGVSPEAASTLPVAAGTAYDALTCLDLRAGSTLLVNGAAGGVGLALVQLAKVRGITSSESLVRVSIRSFTTSAPSRSPTATVWLSGFRSLRPAVWTPSSTWSAGAHCARSRRVCRMGRANLDRAVTSKSVLSSAALHSSAAAAARC